MTQRRNDGNRTATFMLVAVMTLVAAFTGAGCTSVDKQGGLFHARGTGLKFFTFTLPRTDLETVSDAITREIGADAAPTNISKTAFLEPWYNFLYPILGVEVIEVYGTY